MARAAAGLRRRPSAAASRPGREAVQVGSQLAHEPGDVGIVQGFQDEHVVADLPPVEVQGVAAVRKYPMRSSSRSM